MSTKTASPTSQPERTSYGLLVYFLMSVAVVGGHQLTTGQSVPWLDDLLVTMIGGLQLLVVGVFVISDLTMWALFVYLKRRAKPGAT